MQVTQYALWLNYIRALNLVLLSYLVILMQDKELETKENII